jgi:hypothetical protein
LSDDAESIGDMGGITAFERVGEQFGLRLCTAKMFGEIERDGFEGHGQTSLAILMAFLMSRFWVDLSPPQSRMMTSLPIVEAARHFSGRSLLTARDPSHPPLSGRTEGGCCRASVEDFRQRADYRPA